jgi:hypothetical protein
VICRAPGTAPHRTAPHRSRMQTIPQGHALEFTASSLSAQTGRAVSREAVLATFCSNLERLMAQPMDVVRPLSPF